MRDEHVVSTRSIVISIVKRARFGETKKRRRKKSQHRKQNTHLSAFMNSNRFVTLLVASTTSCFANIGPINLYTLAPSSKDFNSSKTISFSVACCVNVFLASMFACSSVSRRVPGEKKSFAFWVSFLSEKEEKKRANERETGRKRMGTRTLLQLVEAPGVHAELLV